MDYADEAAKHRLLAEEYRAMAEQTPVAGLRPHYLLLSAVYEALAENEDQLALNFKNSN